MLSRVAERMYWLARNLERAESTARLVRVYGHFLMDLPPSVGTGWRTLIRITGSDQLYSKRYNTYNETDVVHFLLADQDNPGSIMTALASVRENTRTSRDIMPSETWEKVNTLYLYANESLDSGLKRRERAAYLIQIGERCQQIVGMLASTMSRNYAHAFLMMGRHLERADMTSRVIDVGAAELSYLEEQPLPFNQLLWTNVLRSLGAYQMYRLHSRRRVKGEGVLRFLLQDDQFPRSVNYCLSRLQDCIGQLPRHDQPLQSLLALQDAINNDRPERLLDGDLHGYIDRLQLDLIELHQAAYSVWFLIDDETPVMTQSQDDQTQTQTQTQSN